MEDQDKILSVPISFPSAEPVYTSQAQDPNVASLWSAEIIDPVALGFIPPNTWAQKMYSLISLRETYFAKKNNVNRRFEHKLWNALRITTAFPQFDKIVGCVWASDKIIKVYKTPFAFLLGITTIDGGLFHKQGNFTRHGFSDMAEYDAVAALPPDQLADVDYREVHLLYTKDGSFSSTSTEQSISQCKWVNPQGASRVASLKI